MTKLWQAALFLALASALPLAAQSTPGAQNYSTPPPSTPALPDAPLATAPATPAKPTAAHAATRVMNWSYWTVNGALVGATLADAQTLYNCPNCTYVPSSLHRAGLLYGAGLPADVLVMYLGYRLKEHHHRWWPAPAVALAATNAFLAYHWASKTN